MHATEGKPTYCFWQNCQVGKLKAHDCSTVVYQGYTVLSYFRQAYWRVFPNKSATLHENHEPEAIFVYKFHQLVIILSADMWHRWDAAAAWTDSYNIQNHVRWINPDLLRHVSS